MAAQAQTQAQTQPQQLVLPTLYALLPSSSYTSFISQLSLLAVHAAPYTVRDDIYNPTNTVLPQPRTLRFRAKRRYSGDSSRSRKGKEKEVVIDDEDDENWDYDLNHVSGLMNASEYRDMEVRSYIGIDVVAEKSREGIESFLEAMDFKLSHSYTRSGIVFHLPTPLMLLNLTITRLLPEPKINPGGGPVTPPLENTSEPYLVQLEPCRPVPSQPTRNEPPALEVMGAMRDFAMRISGVYWSRGR